MYPHNDEGLSCEDPKLMKLNKVLVKKVIERD